MNIRALNAYEFKIDGKKYIGAVEDVVKESGLTEDYLRKIIDAPDIETYGELIGKKYPVFYMMDRATDMLQMKGTRHELAQQLDIQMESLYKHTKYKLIFADEYKFEAIEEVREPEETSQPVKKKSLMPFAGPVPFRASRYVESLYQSYFKKWSDVK